MNMCALHMANGNDASVGQPKANVFCVHATNMLLNECSRKNRKDFKEFQN